MKIISVKVVQNTYNGMSFNFKSLKTHDVQCACEDINPKKSCSWDKGLPPKLLKKVASGVAPSLAAIYNNCIKSGQWPTVWKMEEWTPLFKKGDRDTEKNYRPITSLISVDKIFDQILSKQITSYYDSTLHNRITAYRRQHSCETSLLSLVEEWKLAVDKKEIVMVLSTDMNKAFDSLCHSLTVKKLEAYGFGSDSLNLIQSFFRNRFNRVKLNQSTSGWNCMERGCPKGSAFGPLMWNLFQNDMSSQIKQSNLTMYADDHQLYVTETRYGLVESKLTMQDHMASTWYKENLLLANPDKHQLLTINPRNVDQDNKENAFQIDGREIKKAEQMKLLGVNFDENLDFSPHISDVCTRVSQKVGVLVRLRNLIPCSAKLILYKTSIMPHLTYCHLVWNFCKASDSRKIERLQERALRAVFNSKSENYEQLLIPAKLPTLYNRRLQDIVILMYKVKNGLLASSSVSELFQIKHSGYSLRNSDFNIPRFTTILWKTFFEISRAAYVVKIKRTS